MQYNKKSVEDIDVSGKKVIARCDFNVPQDENGNITDDKRIRASLETINYLLDHNAAVILCSHLGRPKGEVNMKYSLAPVAKRLSELLGKEVKLAKDVVGEDAKKLAAEVKPGEVVLLENVRFEKGETKNDPALAKAMASLADVYVSDAFGAVHRAHASTAGVAAYLPAVSGFLIQKELEDAIASRIIDSWQHPVARLQVLLRYLYIKGGAAGEGGHLRGVQLSVQVFGLALFCKDHRRIVKVRRCRHRDADAGCLDGQNLVDLLPCKPAAELFSDLVQQADVHLVVQKAVHLQHVALFYLSILQNSLFQFFHFFRLPLAIPKYFALLLLYQSILPTSTPICNKKAARCW